MLVHINVKNIALIDEVSLELHENLNILTGETGAGKSMLIDSINFALGGRTSKSIIRRGEKYASVELLFHHNNEKVLAKLDEFDIKHEDGYVLISRTLHLSGKTIYKINGQTVTRSMLKEISVLLLDVHGQHEHQSLLDASAHIELLDRFGGKTLTNYLDKLERLYEKYNQLKTKLENLMGDDKKRVQMIDILQFQIKEIKEANLKVGEDDTLMEEMKLLSNAEKIKENLNNAYMHLHTENAEIRGAADVLGEAISAISTIADMSGELKEIYLQLQNIETQVWDIIPQIRHFNETIEYNPEVLFEVQQRLDLIYKLKRKYGNTIEEILSYYNQLCTDLDGLENSEEQRKQVKKEIDILEQEMILICDSITKIRIAQAEKISTLIEQELHELQMENAKFKIDVSSKSKISKNGMDEVEFLITTNLGEPMQPLEKIASGGEMSRVMLAIKTVLAGVDEISTLIFDEIDTGISGRTAQKVAEKLAFIANKHQVICITHLAQIAAMADHHYLIEKNNDENRTNTSVNLLNDDLAVQEISRLMGGAIITSTTIENASEIKNMAIEFKQALVQKSLA